MHKSHIQDLYKMSQYGDDCVTYQADEHMNIGVKYMCASIAYSFFRHTYVHRKPLPIIKLCLPLSEDCAALFGDIVSGEAEIAKCAILCQFNNREGKYPHKGTYVKIINWSNMY